MRTVEDFVGLPDDPEEAFFLYCDEMKRVCEAEKNLDNWEAERSLIDAVMAFQEVHNIEIITFRGDPDDLEDGDFGPFFSRFLRQIDRVTLKLKLERARRIKSGGENILVLDEPSRTKIRSLIEKIKEKLETMELSQNKRDALFSKLNAFLNELDQSLTRTEAFNRFVVDAFRTFGSASEEIKPLWERIDRVLDWLDKAKKWSESLPPWSERKQISPPKKALPKPSDDGVDEEIPF